MTYLLDTNVFIEAKNRYYGLDFCPAFWEWLGQAHAAGVVFSIDKVATELTGQEDQLASWAGHRPRTFFLEADPALLPSLQVLSGWAIGAGYKPAAVTTFLGGADYYLVAHAHGHNHIVVTQEVPAPPPSKSIKIPDACLGVGVKSVNVFEMLRAERARFVLGTLSRC